MKPFPYAKILVTGEEAFDFLQAQVSNDLQLLENRDRLLSAWCNPKGRVICLMTVLSDESGYGVASPRVVQQRAEILIWLRRYGIDRQTGD